MNCRDCGQECREDVPLSAMGERMYGRGVEEYICINPRCSLYGMRQ